MYRRLGNLYEYRRDQKNATATFRKVMAIGEARLAKAPGDEDVLLQLGQVYLASANQLHSDSDLDGARTGYLRAIELMKEVEKRQPNHWEMLSALGSAYSGEGMCESRLRRFDAAMEAYQQAEIRFEAIRKQNPSNIYMKRNLMLLYSHIGDLRGNPAMPNMGDRQGAVEPFRKMLEIARSIHEADTADQRARSDYAIALSRVAAVQAPEEVHSRIQMLRQAIELQKQLSSENLSNRADMSASYNMLGDAYTAGGDASNALRAYRDGVQAAESTLASANPNLLARIISLYRKLGLAAAGNGDRKTALEYGRKALETSEPRADKKRTAESQTVLSARGMATKGLILVALGGARDREEARTWLKKGLELYRELEGQPMVTADYRADVKTIESELEKLK